MLKVSQISEEQVDLLIFVLTGVSPCTKVCDLGCQTKGQARDACRSQYLVRMRKNPSRLDIMAEELDNLPMVALRCGYDPALFSPELREKYQEATNRSGAMQAATVSPCVRQAREEARPVHQALEDAKGECPPAPTTPSSDVSSMTHQAPETPAVTSTPGPPNSSVVSVLPPIKLPRRFRAGLISQKKREILTMLAEGEEADQAIPLPGAALILAEAPTETEQQAAQAAADAETAKMQLQLG